MEENYYVCDNFSTSLYIKLAKAGFISTSAKLSSEKTYLLPEIQFEYAVLDFKDLHISKKVSKLIKQNIYTLKESKNFNFLIEEIDNYHNDSWLNSEYKEMLLELLKIKNQSFQLLGFELISSNTNKTIGGEIGYKIGKTYTSLTGFFKREKEYNNCGKLQLVFLSKYLEKENYDFWNLGHACLQYKIDLGAKVLKRKEFLIKWFKSTKNSEIQ